MNTRRKIAATVLAGALCAPLAQAQHDHHGHGAPSAPAGTALADGEVRKVDKAKKRITLKHGPITNLDMPAHTMVFHVGDPAMLDRVEPGDKVRFSAEKRDGAFTVISIEPVR
jgi:Cu(I)/Ag(I) efflux system periplasmic protein CusF